MSHILVVMVLCRDLLVSFYIYYNFLDENPGIIDL